MAEVKVPRCDECGSKNVYRKQDASWSEKNRDWTEIEGVEYHCFQCGNSKVDVEAKFYGGFIWKELETENE
mgnify:FL=1|tara:strand:- start:1831 stop:2043 length:213 start_codon:yes stop_codon:yes gene_type:complete